MKNVSISFLEASKLIRDVSEFPEQDLCINTSASVHQLNHYLKAMGAGKYFCKLLYVLVNKSNLF